MKIKWLTAMITLITTIGCVPIRDQPDSQMIYPSRPISTLTPAKVVTPTSSFTRTPRPTVTSTSTTTTTPLPGHRIWNQGSVPEYYAIQFHEDDWAEEENNLIHKQLQGCSLGVGGGSDICMSGGCSTSNVTLGEIEFGKTVVSNSTAIYSSNPLNYQFIYQAWLGEDPAKCIQEVENVLGTIKLRPERSCTDHATFIEDITIPDDTTIPSGTSFTKTWRIKNTGSCPWSQEYSLYLVGITPNADVYQKVYLQSTTSPGQTNDISVELTAPPIQGVVRWEWMFQNEIGDLFGVGDAPYNPFPGVPIWVQIIVVPSPPTVPTNE